MKRLLNQTVLFTLACFSIAAQADCSRNTAIASEWMTLTARYIYLNGGTEVQDLVTGLIWARCSVGQGFSDNGTAGNFTDDRCTGNATRHSWAEALAAADAATQTSDAPWALPDIKQLYSLTEPPCNDPAVDPVVFPDTPFGTNKSYWSSTPKADAFNSSNRVWIWNPGTGDISDSGFSLTSDTLQYYFVRIVRPIPSN